jgi:uncharacterized protein YbjQ (UPF0145 family)
VFAAARHALPRIPEHAAMPGMLVLTTDSVPGRTISRIFGLVSGEAIVGANLFKDLFAGFRDLVEGRSAAYERELRKARDTAINDMLEEAAALGANGVIGVDLDYESIQVKTGGNMLMVSASGTAVLID